MEAHDDRPNPGPGSVARRLLDELAEAVGALPAARRQKLVNDLEGRMLADELKQAITDSGLTAYALAKRAGTSPDVITRFVSGERDLRLETAGKIAAALGLGLRPIDPPTAATEKPRPAAAKKPTEKPAASKASKNAPGGRKPTK